MDQKPASAAFIHNLHGDAGVELQLALSLLSGSVEEWPFLYKLHAAFCSHALTVISAEMQLRVIVSGLFDNHLLFHKLDVGHKELITFGLDVLLREPAVFNVLYRIPFQIALRNDL